MKRAGIMLLLCGVFLQVDAQQINAYMAADIKAYAHSPDTVYVINFWATWCQPCVQELPIFNELHRKFANSPVKILMVSLDFKDSYPYKLQGFLKRKPLLPDVVWLAETDPNSYIPKIEPSWEGSIPATLIIRPHKDKTFLEGQLNYRKLSAAVDKLLGNSLKK
jgi:thiol-disulfide isomerase/thioredoxin